MTAQLFTLFCVSIYLRIVALQRTVSMLCTGSWVFDLTALSSISTEQILCRWDSKLFRSAYQGIASAQTIWYPQLLAHILKLFKTFSLTLSADGWPFKVNRWMCECLWPIICILDRFMLHASRAESEMIYFWSFYGVKIFHAVQWRTIGSRLYLS